MTHDPYDMEDRTTPAQGAPDDPYIRRPYGSAYGGSGIAFVIFGVVAVLLIGFAMFGGYPNNETITPTQTTEQIPQAQPEQPTTPQPAAPSTNQ